jgi:hypothetical protein
MLLIYHGDLLLCLQRLLCSSATWWSSATAGRDRVPNSDAGWCCCYLARALSLSLSFAAATTTAGATGGWRRNEGGWGWHEAAWAPHVAFVLDDAGCGVRPEERNGCVAFTIPAAGEWTVKSDATVHHVPSRSVWRSQCRQSYCYKTWVACQVWSGFITMATSFRAIFTVLRCKGKLPCSRFDL